MRTRVLAILGTLAVLGAGVGEARAQAPTGFLRPHAIEVDVGGTWLAGVDFGGADATLTRNQSARAAYTLFSTATSLGGTPGAEGRVGYLVTRAIAIEGAFLFARPSLRASISGDVEGAPALTARETISQFMVDVSGVLHLRSLRVGRSVPFVLGGAGYLRELHEGELLVQTGHTYHLGAGVKVPVVVRQGFVRSLGLRADARLYFRSGGADLDSARPTRTMAAAGASLFLAF